MTSLAEPNLNDLVRLATFKMPFGKYTGTRLIDLPEPYVVWLCQQELPKGELGQLLSQLYEVKVNGLEYLFEPLKESTVSPSLQESKSPRIEKQDFRNRRS
jgi:uncharacterized protein (DUF3820 family)